MRHFPFVSICLALILLGPAAISSQATITLTLEPSLPSPQPLGTTITWTATATDANAGTLWYQFSAGPVGSPQVIIDFAPGNSFQWTPSDHEGTYEILVIVRNTTTGGAVALLQTFTATSLVSGNSAVVTPTANPLVALYSAPPCAPGSTIHVQFSKVEGEHWAQTLAKPCVAGQSMNFYIAGMLGNTPYRMTHIISGVQRTWPALTFTTGTPAITQNSFVVVGPPAGYPHNIILHSPIARPTAQPLATDLQGNLVWYYSQPVDSLTRPSPGGNMLVLTQTATDFSHQLIRMIDVAGNTLRETNVARVNEFLQPAGRSITGFSHEARLLQNGDIITIGYTERILSGVQGPAPVDILGDILLVLNPSLQVTWFWDTFDHLDVTRAAVLGEVCKNTPPTPGCPALKLAQQANDWVHGNSLEVAPDGSMIYSSRHQDFVYKIDYGNGNGTGSVLWKLGKGGDFTYYSTDPYPWFSHQHDANINFGNTLLTVFDDGDTRIQLGGFGTTSRGQALNIDETNKIVTFAVNGSLGQFFPAAGSAQFLPDGYYHFGSGLLSAIGWTQATDLDANGNIVYVLQSNFWAYRSFELQNMYSYPWP